jgi:hypothetical protein
MCMGLGCGCNLILACPLSDDTSLAFLEGSLVSFLRRCSKIIFPHLRGPAAIEVDVVYLIGIATLIVIVTSWS